MKVQERMSSTSGSRNSFKNMTRDLTTLSSIKMSGNAARQVTALSDAMRNFKAPSAAKVKNIRSAMQSLSNIKISAASANNLAKIATAMRALRGPSAAETKNLITFISALKTMRIPRGLTHLATELYRVSAAASMAKNQFSGFKNNVNRLNLRRFQTGISGIGAASHTANAGVMRLTGGFRGLENAMSASYQLGSQLRVLFGTLTVSGLTTGMYDATIALERFNTTIGVTAKSQQEATQTIGEARRIANSYGIDLGVVYDEFGKFSTAARLAGRSQEEVNYIFEQTSGAMRVMGLGADRQRLVFLALTQMFSKGKISAEELRRQLGEQIPGAFELMKEAVQEATGEANINLDDMLKKGELSSDAVVLLAKKIQEKFGPQVAAAMARADAAVGRLRNQWTDFLATIGKSGGLDALGKAAFRLTQSMKSTTFKQVAKDIGEGLGEALDYASRAAKFLIDNIDTVKNVAKALIALKLGSSIVELGVAANTAGNSLLSMGKKGALAGSLIKGGLALAIAGLLYYRDSVIKLNHTTVTVGDLSRQTFANVGKSLLDMGTQGLQGMSDIVNAFNTGGETISLRWRDVVNYLIRILLSIIETAKYVGRAVAKALEDPIKAALFAAHGQWSDAFSSFGDAVNPIKKAKDQIAEFTKYIKDLDDMKGKNYIGNLVSDAAIASTKRLNEMLKKSREEAEKQKKFIDEAVKKSQESIDTTGIDPRIAGDKSSSSLKGTAKAAKAAKEALALYKSEVEKLNTALAAGEISQRQYTNALEYQKKKLQEAQDPYAAMIRSLQEEINLKMKGGRAAKLDAAYRDAENTLLEKGIALNAENANRLRELISLKQKLNDPNSLQGFIAGIDDLDTALDKVTTKALGGLSDEIANLVVDGKADFASLAKSILKEFVKIGVNQVYKWLFGGLMGGQQQIAPIKVGDITGIQSPTAMSVATQEVQAGVVNINGTELGGFNLRGSLDQYGKSTAVTAGNAGKIDTSQWNLRGMPTGGKITTTELRSQIAKTNGTINPFELGRQTAVSKPVPVEVKTVAKTALPTVPTTGTGGGAPASGNFGDILAARGKPNAFTNAFYQKGRGMGLNDVQARLMASQAAQESGYGVHAPGNNFFGIKAGKSWKGDVQRLRTTEYNAAGQPFKTYAKFRKYATPEEGMQDRVNFMNSRFAKAQNAPTFEGAVKGLGQGKYGAYATDPNYFNAIRQQNARIQPNAYDNMVTNTAGTTAGTGGIDALNQKIPQLNQTLQQTGSAADTATQKLNSAKEATTAEANQKQMATQQSTSVTQQEVAAKQQSSMASQQSIMAKQQESQSSYMVAQSAQQASPSVQQFGSSVQQAGMQAQMAGTQASTATPGMGGLGSGIMGLMGPLSQAIPGIGQFGGMILQLVQQMMTSSSLGGAGGLLGGLFREGGVATSPVATSSAAMGAFKNAPSYRDGTASTGPHGQTGIPAFLHPNEAVIPLSRGRSIPVEMKGTNVNGQGTEAGYRTATSSVEMHIHGVQDVDGFHRSQKQIAAKQAAALDRANRRQN